MPTLTTQSIGVAGIPLTTGQHAATIAQSSKSATEGGVKQAQNQARAAAATTSVKSGKNRSVQEEKRSEGLFEHLEEDEDETSNSDDTTKKKRKPYSRVA
jgi:hypothetical protein